MAQSRWSDRIAGAIFLALAIWYWIEAGSYAVRFGDPAGPSFFPRMVAVPMGVFALFLIVRPDADPVWFRWPQVLAQAATLAVLFGYPMAIEPLGFPISTLIATMLLAKILGATWLQAVLLGAGMGFGLFFLFDAGFGLPLPAGPIFG
ncbi:tripartite tricarboxylate transporter TctB family protein [Salinarimonas sp.]|uniref:tripartite tricarboxylate transporter TctB family protein n=1 Tax=Salinarimonas sp. TaxID=2766526 RepID=UPI0032D8E6E0